MPEWLDLFRCPFPFMIGMAIDTGVVGKTFMKENFATLFFQHCPGNSFKADVTLFVTTDALH